MEIIGFEPITNKCKLLILPLNYTPPKFFLEISGFEPETFNLTN